MRMRFLLLMVCCLMGGLVANAQDSGTTGKNRNLTWTFSNHVLTISGTDEMGNEDGTDYKSIQVPWKNQTTITTVIMENGVASIASYAFGYYFPNLASVTIPNSVTSIGDYSFYNSSLTSIIIPKKVGKIGDNAFAGCSSLATITVLNTTPPEAKSGTFSGLTPANITLKVPSGSVDAYKVADVWKDFIDNIEGIEVEDDEITFTPEDGATGVALDATVSAIFDEITDYSLAQDGEKITIQAKDAEDYLVEAALVKDWISEDNTTLTIPHDDFEQNTTYTVTIPIGTINSNEEAITWSFTTKQTIFTGTVDNKDSEKDAITWTFDSTTGVLTISGAGEMQDYSNGQTGHWFTHKADIQTVVVEKGITEIGAYSFFEFSNLTSVSFPEGLTSIISYAFLNTALTSITLPESLSNLGSEAFFGCSSLAEVTALNPKAFQISDRRIFERIAEVATLYVPASGLADYKLDFYGWTEFFSFILPISSTPSVYHTLNLEVADGIDLYNLTAGNLQVEDGGHLYLQFMAEDRSLAANDILFLIDGIETTFKELGENNYFSYILNPVTQDHTILIALREYPVTLPEVDGITYNVGAGTHWIGYSEKFTFTLTLADGIDPANVHVFANGREIEPDALRSVVLTYTIDKVITPITVVIEGAGDPVTGNADIARGDIQLRITNYELQIENTNSQAVDVAVYAVTGQSVVQLRGLRGSKSIRLQPGIYLVKAGSEVYKVSVK